MLNKTRKPFWIFSSNKKEQESLSSSSQHIRSLSATSEASSNFKVNTVDEIKSENTNLQQIEQDFMDKLSLLKNESELSTSKLERELDHCRVIINQLTEENRKLEHLYTRQYQQNLNNTRVAELEVTIENLLFDLQDLQAQLDHSRADNENYEKDFRLFSRKISSQQQRIQQLLNENDSLKASLRQYQFGSDDQDSYYKEKLEQALYDNEALKLYISELQNRPVSTKEPELKSSIDHRPESSTKTQDSLENGADQLRDRWAQVKESLVDPFETMSFLDKRDTLNNELSALMDQKTQLTFELSRIPLSNSGKNRQRQHELDALLDAVDEKIQKTRKRMKDLGVL